MTDEQSYQKGKISFEVVIYTILLTVTGTVCTIGYKVQAIDYNFKHGFFQSYLMVIGEFLNLFIVVLPLIFSKTKRKRHFQELEAEAIEYKKSMQTPLFLLGIPSALDGLVAALQINALLLMPTSVNNILTGGSIITTCLISKFMLGRDILRHHYFGIFIAFIGMTLVGISSEFNEQTKEQYSVGGLILGMILIGISLVLQGFQINLEEWLTIKYAVPPERIVGMEGMLGMAWIIIWMSILSFFPCTSDDLCTIGGNLEDPIIALKEAMASTGMICWSLAITVSLMFYNLAAMSLNKQMSCVYMTFWDNTSIAIIWTTSLFLGFESWDWVGSSIQVVGFVLLIIGNLTYSEILEWKVFNLNAKLEKYTTETEDG